MPQKVATSFGSLINFNFREQDFFFSFLEIFLIALCTELTYALFLRRETVMAGSCPGRERCSKFSLNYLCGFRCCPVLQRFSIEQEFPSFHIPRLDDQLAFLVRLKMDPGEKCLLSAESARGSRKQWVGRFFSEAAVSDSNRFLAGVEVVTSQG